MTCKQTLLINNYFNVTYLVNIFVARELRQARVVTCFCIRARWTRKTLHALRFVTNVADTKVHTRRKYEGREREIRVPSPVSAAREKQARLLPREQLERNTRVFSHERRQRETRAFSLTIERKQRETRASSPMRALISRLSNVLHSLPTKEAI